MQTEKKNTVTVTLTKHKNLGLSVASSPKTGFSASHELCVLDKPNDVERIYFP